jgi:hypothetical protein
MKKYVGMRDDDQTCTVLVQSEEGSKELPPGFHVRNHSPDGFNWGYGGSGPAQLALAILLDHLDGNKDEAQLYYQLFKFKVIANIAEARWELTDAQVEEALSAIREAGHRTG